jgi:hypothetical protein
MPRGVAVDRLSAFYASIWRTAKGGAPATRCAAAGAENSYLVVALKPTVAPALFT